MNGLKVGDVKCIKDDILEHKPIEQFDLVYSVGLIEHFTDLETILKAHKKFMKPGGGFLLIIVPNFLGVNGFLQKLFDKENLAIHNLKAMEINSIKKILADLGLSQIEASYYPSTQVWIENLDQRGIFLNFTIRVINKFMYIAGRVFGKKNKFISNSIYWIARL